MSYLYLCGNKDNGDVSLKMDQSNVVNEKLRGAIVWGTSHCTWLEALE